MGRSMVNSGSQRQLVLAVVWLGVTALLIVIFFMPDGLYGLLRRLDRSKAKA